MQSRRVVAGSVPSEAYALLTAKLVQPRELLLTISGSGFSSFTEFAELEQERALWLAADLVDAANELVERQE